VALTGVVGDLESQPGQLLPGESLPSYVVTVALGTVDGDGVAPFLTGAISIQVSLGTVDIDGSVPVDRLVLHPTLGTIDLDGQSVGLLAAFRVPVGTIDLDGRSPVATPHPIVVTATLGTVSAGGIQPVGGDLLNATGSSAGAPAQSSGLLSQLYLPWQNPVAWVVVGGQYRTLTRDPIPGAQEYMPVEWYTDDDHPYQHVRILDGSVEHGVSESGPEPGRADLTIADRLDETSIYEIYTRGNIPLLVHFGFWDPPNFYFARVFTGYVRDDSEDFWPYTNHLAGVGMLWRLGMPLPTTLKLKDLQEWEIHSKLYQAVGVKGWDLDGDTDVVLANQEQPYKLYKDSTALSIVGELDRITYELTHDTPEGNIRRRRLPTASGNGNTVWAFRQMVAGQRPTQGVTDSPLISATRERDQNWLRNEILVLGKPSTMDGAAFRPLTARHFDTNLVPDPPRYLRDDPLQSDWLETQAMVDHIADRYSRHKGKVRRTVRWTGLFNPYPRLLDYADVLLPTAGYNPSQGGVIRRVRHSFGGRGLITETEIDLGYGRLGDVFGIGVIAHFDLTVEPDTPTPGFTTVHAYGRPFTYNRDTNPQSDDGITYYWFNDVNSVAQQGSAEEDPANGEYVVVLTAEEIAIPGGVHIRLIAQNQWGAWDDHEDVV
jgi:hypothetical protein